MSAEDDLETAKRLFAEVRHGLDVNKSIQWNLAVETFRACVPVISQPETQEFLDSLFFKIIDILTSQNPRSIGKHEQTCISDSVYFSVEIITLALQENNNRYLNVLLKILDSTTKHYAGTKINFIYFAGFPEARKRAMMRFAELNGYKILLDLLRNPEFPWPGCGELFVLLKPLTEFQIDSDLREMVISEVMKKLIALPDEQAKKEAKITDLIKVMEIAFSWRVGDQVIQIRKLQAFHDFWLQFTLKTLSSGSIVLRLFGWEQVHELIREVYYTRPEAEAYLVKGAGNPDANGEYRFSAKVDGANNYVKEPTRKDMPLLTLFRCAMRNKSKWWFISVQDKEKPCTDKDVDYYQHKSLPAEEREPPPRGWICAGTLASAPGREPAPTLQRLGALLPAGVTKEMYLEHRLPIWALENDLLGQVFKASPHREVISRSAKLVSFLAEVGTLTPEHLQLIWRAAVQTHDADVADEIYSLLVSVSSFLSDELNAVLIDLALETLDEAGASQFLKAAGFVEKYTHNRDVVSSFSTAASSKLLSLVWAVYKNPSFETLKASAQIQDLLSQCLRRPGGEQIVLNSVRECCAQLQTTAPPESASMDSSASVLTVPGGETAASRVVHTLLFLISKTMPHTVVATLEEEGMTGQLIAEIERFLLANRPRFISGEVDKKWYTGEITSRLQALRQFYGIDASVMMKVPMCDRLWPILSAEPCEIDCLFAMFFSGANRNFEFNMMAPFEVFCHIFTFIICNPQVDWGLCGEVSFDCFRKYYTGLDYREVKLATYAREDLPPRLGLDTLWNIALHTTVAGPQRASAEMLLKSYEDIILSDPDAHLQMVHRILERIESLKAIEGDSNATPSGDTTLSPRSRADSAAAIGRCVEMLHTFIAKSKASESPAHSMRGCMTRLRLTVNFRRVSSFWNYTTQQTTLRTEKGTELTVTLDMHPMHSILQLKSKIASAAHVSLATLISLEGYLKQAQASSRLMDCQINDGAVINAHTPTPTINKTYDSDSYGLDLDDEQRLPSIGQIIAETRPQFDTLLALAESENAEVAKGAWQLIMVLPTQPAILQAVQYGPPSEADSWRTLLEHPSLAVRTYGLQVIDHFLLPAPELRSEENLEGLKLFKQTFLEVGGFTDVLRLFCATPAVGGAVNETTLSVALHILHFLLFENNLVEEGEETKSSLAAQPELLTLVQESSAVVIEKLLSVASSAAAAERSGVVNDSLITLNFLLAHSPEAVSQLISNPASKSLLVTVLRSGSKQVREMASGFAVQVGKTQPVVLSWLLAELKGLADNDDLCQDTFRALKALLIELSQSFRESVDWADLATTLTLKINSYTQNPASVAPDSAVLQGYLQLLESLIQVSPASLEATEMTHETLASMLIDSYLFTMPSDGEDRSPICDVATNSKSAVFGVLSALAAVSPDVFKVTFQKLKSLAGKTAENVSTTWNLQISFDVKRPDIAFSGLKNQGCTCYMNSLLQNLFMNVSFREAILSAPLKECHRLTMWHRTDEELVGCDLLIEWLGGQWRKGKVVGWDMATQCHVVEYETEDQVHLNLREGRYGQETGVFRIAPLEGDEEITEREVAAQRVLEQLQRTFSFMKFSKRRYFDPRPLVEACKTLNMNFNVYHQNDASEFCDQLLDRIELATKGKHTGSDVWEDVFQQSIFGGKFLYQKIPQECEAYQVDKKQCGHWQSSRQESFMKIELIIRNKDNIHDSLADLVAGELMDGDNKINCEVCTQKKATTRRTCLAVLPNTLILHLKRFDLDFTTFETVKLNNRMAFETKLNLMKYTKEGMELEERKALQATAAEQGDGEAGGKDQEAPEAEQQSDFVEPDPEDFEYELQGVLVHAGIAQGGHYYSFVKDAATADKWYRFDDEDVTSFNPEHIPFQCFGGPASTTTTTAGMTSTFEEDRTSNALMLFFNKVRPHSAVPPSPAKVPEAAGGSADVSATPAEVTGGGDGEGKEDATPADVIEGGDGEGKKDGEGVEAGGPADAVAEAVAGGATAVVAPPLPQSRLIDGHTAFQREVGKSNFDHLLSRYMFDADLHTFVRELLSSVVVSRSVAGGDAAIVPAVAAVPEMPRTFAWLAGASPDTAMEAIAFSCNFLFDVVLHCRERQGVRGWVNVLKLSFETYPDSAVWFMRKLIGVAGAGAYEEWLGGYLLQCGDALARGTFVQVVTQAVKTLVNLEGFTEAHLFEALRENLADTRDSLTTSPAAGCSTDPVYISKLLIVFIESVIIKIHDVPTFSRNADDLFVLIREIAAFPPICAVLLRLQTVSRLAYFVEPKTVSANVQKAFAERSQHTRGYKQDAYYNVYFPSILEALAALLGVPQTRKVPLVQDKVGWEYELVPEAREAFVAIFQEVAPKGTMDANAIVEYRERTGIRVNIQQAKSIMTHERTNAEGKLTLEGFLHYYADNAAYHPKEAWRDLHSFRFRNDLTRASPVITSAAGAGADGADALQSAEAAALTYLSKECVVCLRNINLYISSGVDIPEAARAIAKRICASDERVTNLLIGQALEKIRVVASDYAWGPELNPVIEFLKMLLQVEEASIISRLRTILLCETQHAIMGLALMVVMEERAPSRCRTNDLDKRAMHRRYLTFLEDICNVRNVRQAMAVLAEQDERVRHVKGQLKMPGSILTENEDSRIRNSLIIVTDAGTPEVNGVYKFHTMLDKWNCGLYTKPGHYQNKEVTFTLYKCNVNNGGYQWFISITPEGCEPGSAKDIDFYYALATHGINSIMPPENWNAFVPNTQKPFSRAPAPIVRISNGAGTMVPEPMPSPPPVVPGPVISGSGLGQIMPRTHNDYTDDGESSSDDVDDSSTNMAEDDVHVIGTFDDYDDSRDDSRDDDPR